MFGRIDRQLCHAFNVERCPKKKKTKAAKSKPAPPAPTAPAAAVPPAPAAPEAEKLAPAPVPPQPVVAEKPKAEPPKEKVRETPVPLPQLRPENLGPKKEVTAPPVPVPVPAPEVKKVAPVAPVPASPVVVEPVLPPSPHPMPDNTLTGEACYAQLEKLGAKFERLSTPLGSGICLVSDPVKLTALSRDGNDVKFPDAPTFNCGFAVRFVSWVTEQAEPVVLTGLNSKIVTMGTGPGYQCRGRNGDSSAKISEHGFGNAVDIERLKLADGEVIEVSIAIDTTSKYQPVLAGLRSAGCQYFMTVLGPGANSAHASHFHFDLERRGKKGNNKLCE
jgi:hypothetical protein